MSVVVEWDVALARAILTPSAIRKLDLPKREAILGQWFREGDLGFIYGPRGLGKTWLALLLGCAISEGRDVGPWSPPKENKVLYVDGEMALDAALQRSEQLLKEDDRNFRMLQHEPLFHLSEKVLNLTSLEAQAALTEKCLTLGIKVLILDNISCLLTLKENESDAWGEKVLPWLLTLRRHHIAVIFVHHSGRNGHMRGTSKREDAAFWTIKLSAARGEPNSTGATFVAAFDKNRNSTDEETPTLLWHFESKPDGSLTPHWKKLQPLQIFVDLVEDGLDSCTDIAQEMGVAKSTVSKLARRADKEGAISIVRRHYRPRGDR